MILGIKTILRKTANLMEYISPHNYHISTAEMTFCMTTEEINVTSAEWLLESYVCQFMLIDKICKFSCQKGWIAMLLNQQCECGQRPREPQIITVEKGEIVSTCNRSPAVSCRSRPPIPLLDDLNTTTKLLDRLYGAIS